MSDIYEQPVEPPEPDTVYLMVKEGRVIPHTNLKAMKELEGTDAYDLAVSIREFQEADGLARLIDGEIVLGKTEAEKQAEANRVRIAEIDRRLQELDTKSIRPGRAVSLAVGSGETPDTADVERLAGYEAEIAALREERGGLA
jgi:hypothetical protein